MKKILTAAMIFGSICLVSSAGADIGASAHDFSGSIWSAGQICIPCHAPHNNGNATGDLLWNHAVSTATYGLYSSPTMDATPGQPTGVSKMCLSCHDGTTAIDSFGGATGGNMITSGNLGIALSDDHPISFTYDDALAAVDGELFVPSADPSNMLAGGTIAEDMLYNGEMHCSSCHDVHNAYSNNFLLNVNNGGSALCLTCHNK